MGESCEQRDEKRGPMPARRRRRVRPWRVRLLVYGGVLFALAAYVSYCSWFWSSSNAATASADDAVVTEDLRHSVQELVTQFPVRNLSEPARYAAAGRYLAGQLEARGGRAVRAHVVSSPDGEAFNYSQEYVGASYPDEWIVIGAHYDTAPGTPGADDNGSGVALLLAVASHFHSAPLQRSLRLVLFANEEPPYFQSEWMGSLQFARELRDKQEDVRLMLSLESLGYFTEAPHSQKYPFPFGLVYPSQGNFVAVVGQFAERGVVARSLSAFRSHADLPAEGGALPNYLPGIGWSDHWSFWEVDYPALMLTDTAPFRSPHYHQHSDSADELDYRSMARVARGVIGIVNEWQSDD